MLSAPGGAARKRRPRRALPAAAVLAGLVVLATSQSSLEVGYTLLTPDAGSVLPVGTALFTYTNADGVLVSQAGVGAVEPGPSATIFVDEVGTRTGLALVNPSSESIVATLTLRDAAGRELERATRTLAPREHFSSYVFQLFTRAAPGFRGSLRLESPQNLAAITLRETRNAAGEPLYATLPVAVPQAAPSTRPLVFPQIAAGGGYTTQLVLINTTGQKLTGRITLTASDGQPLALRAGGVTASEFTYEIDPNGVYHAELDRPAGLGVGYAVVTPAVGSSAPAGTAIFQFKRGGALVTEAGVAAAPSTTSARVFVDNAGSFTGVAIANAGSQPATLTLTLLDRFGTELDHATRTLPARNHLALFANQLFEDLPDSFTGLMDVAASVPVSPVTLLETDNARGDQVLTTLPVVDQTLLTAPSALVFPQIAVGAGFSTRLILINRGKTVSTSGSLAFYRSDGSPMVVPLGARSGSHFAYELLGGGGRQFLPGNTAAPATLSVLGTASNQPLGEIAVNAGKSLRPRVLVRDTAGRARDDVDVTFTSLQTDVASVDVSGKILGNKAGFSTLTLTAGGAVATATIVVAAVSAGGSGFDVVGVAQDPNRKLYLANAADNTIMVADDVKQRPAIYAGVPGSAGLRNDLRLQSLFRSPAYLALHQAQGSLYVSDGANNVIRRAQPGPAGRLEPVAGTGTAGSRDGSVQDSTFSNPQGIVLDNRGFLWIVDSGNHTVRRVNLTRGTVETVAGRAGSAGWVDGKGDAARFSSPVGIALEPEPRALEIERERKGLPPPPVRVIVADTGNGVLRRVTQTGEVETVTGGGAAAPGLSAPRTRRTAPAAFTGPTGVAVDPAGNIYVTEAGSNHVKTLLTTGDVVETAQEATFTGPRGIAISQTGRVVVADRSRSAQEVVYGEPQITSVVPDRVSIRGGRTVTITGNNFSTDTLVVAGGVLITGATVRDTRTITFVTPALPSGRGTLTVQNRGGLAQSALLVDPVPLNQLDPGYVTTVAGGSTYVGDGGKATEAPLLNPARPAVDAAGNLYIADFSNNRIRKVDARSGTITSIAGTGRFDFSGDGGPATVAELRSPSDVALDGAGNLYIADTFNSRIRKVSAATGIITTVAGNGSPLYTGDGGPATAAALRFPSGIGLDPADNLWIADSANNVIRRVDTATGRITTVAGTGTAGYGGDGGQAVAARLSSPWDVAFDAAGNAYVAEYGNQRVRKIAAGTGIITTVAGNGLAEFLGDGGQATSASLFYPLGVSIDTSGNLLIAHVGSVRRVAAATGVITTVAGGLLAETEGDGGPATEASIDVNGVAVDAAGNLFVSDFGGGRIRRVDARTGLIGTAAGNGDTSLGDRGPATAAQLLNPYAVAFDATGNLFIADRFNNRIRRVDAATGVMSTVAGSGAYGDAGDGGLATKAEFRYPHDVALDGSGNLYIADTFGNRVRKVAAATGIITTVAGTGAEGDSGDGGAAIAARFRAPQGVAVDRTGNVFISDTLNHRVRRVAAATGLITTVAGNGTQGFSGDGGPAAAAQLAFPDGLAVDTAGNLFVCDVYNHRIRRVDATTRVISTVVGNGQFAPFSGDNGPATGATLAYPGGVTVDAAGNLFIADTFQSRIRRVGATSGVITTLAGDGSYGYAGDNGPATAATLDLPTRVVLDPSANLIFSDMLNDRIRAIRGPVR